MKIRLADIENKTTREFIVFHIENPHVYRLFAHLTMQLIDAGVPRSSGQMIYERMRWEWALMTKQPDGHPNITLNNNYVSRYTRLFTYWNPQHFGFFRMRKLKLRTTNSIDIPDDELIRIDASTTRRKAT